MRITSKVIIFITVLMIPSTSLALDFEAKNSEMNKLHEKVNYLRLREKTSHDNAQEWYTPYFVHAKYELSSFSEYDSDLGDPGMSVIGDDVYPLVKALIDYRKILTEDYKEIILTKGCIFNEIDRMERYVINYADPDNITCGGPFYLDHKLRRKHDLYRIIKAVLPEIEDPWGFALEKGIVSDTYFAGENQDIPINRAELAKITSKLLDYLWNNKEAVKNLVRVEQWYDIYFSLLHKSLDNYYYDLSEFPSEPILNFEIYKLLSAFTDLYLNFSKGHTEYVCNEEDFIFSMDVYTIQSLQGVATLTSCININRNEKLTRVQAVELMMSVIFPEVNDANKFGIENEIFSADYLSAENAKRYMNHAELAKIASNMILLFHTTIN